MVPAFLILFREALEISLILGIILAATHGIPRRALWIWAGIGGGIAGSALVAVFAEQISMAMEGMGQEIFNAFILFIATLMIGWTVIWMQTHGRQLSQKIKHVGKAVHDGELPLYALAVVVSLSMLREGSEIVLFMTGILSTSKEPLAAIAAGGAAGAGIAFAIGLLLYLGLLRMPTRYLFSVTGWMLILLACGMSAQAAGYLIAADWLPALVPQLWDSSWLLSQNGVAGSILHALLGYTDRPAGMQLFFYLSTMAIILILLRTHRKGAMNKNTTISAAISCLIVATSLMLNSTPAFALNVYSPYVEEGIAEIELKNRYDLDDRASEDNFRQHILELAYGVSSWWSVEIEGEWEKDPGDGYHYEATEVYNNFQLTDVGEYWLDAGLQVKYVFKHPAGSADRLKIYALLAKQYTQFTHVANIGIEQETTNNYNRNPKADAKWMTRYLYTPILNPGFEYYGEYGEISDPSDYDAQKHRLGPVIYGALGRGFKYELGWLFGLSKATEDHAVKFNIEYEFPVQFPL